MEESRDLFFLVRRLNQIGIALSAEHSLGRLLEMIVSELRAFTRSDGGSLYIKKGDALSFEVAQNDTLLKRLGYVPFKTFTVPIDRRSIAGYVAATDNPINIPDLDKVGDDTPYSLKTNRDFDLKMGLKTVSMLVVPMRNHKDEIIGVIQLINSLDQNGNPVLYDSWMEELVSSLASQAAVAISNSVLISDIKRVFESLVTYSAQAIDARSPHTAGHSLRVSKLVMRQAEVINDIKEGPFADVTFSEEEMNELRMASWLHDIGKIGVREYVLDKVNKLLDDRIAVIATRFAYLKKACENRGNERKLNLLTEGRASDGAFEEIDRETARTVAELDTDLLHIMKMNKPSYSSDDNFARLKLIAEKTYIDPNGVEQPFIEPFELEPLLVRNGNLTDAERAEMQSHVRHTLNILEKIPFTQELLNIPRFASAHHEMLDGSGYPNRLHAEEIPLQSRIISVADIYDALTAKDRPYKPPLPLGKALGILREEVEKGKLDRDLVELFISREIYSAI